MPQGLYILIHIHQNSISSCLHIAHQKDIHCWSFLPADIRPSDWLPDMYPLSPILHIRMEEEYVGLDQWDFFVIRFHLYFTWFDCSDSVVIHFCVGLIVEFWGDFWAAYVGLKCLCMSNTWCSSVLWSPSIVIVVHWLLLSSSFCDVISKSKTKP